MNNKNRKNNKRICNFTYLLQKAMEKVGIETYTELERKAKMDGRISMLLQRYRLSLSDMNKMCAVLKVSPDYFKECLTENTYYMVNEFGHSTGIWNRKEEEKETIKNESTIKAKIVKSQKDIEKERKERKAKQRKAYYERNKEKILQKNRERYQEKKRAAQKEKVLELAKTQNQEIVNVTENIVVTQEPKKKGFFAKLFGKK